MDTLYTSLRTSLIGNRLLEHVANIHDILTAMEDDPLLRHLALSITTVPQDSEHQNPEKTNAPDMTGSRVPLKTLPTGAYFLIPDRFDDGNGNIEIRLTLKRLEDGIQNVLVQDNLKKPFLRDSSFGMIQGEPGSAPKIIAIPQNPTPSAMPPDFPVLPTGITSLQGLALPEDTKQSKKHKNSPRKRG